MLINEIKNKKIAILGFWKEWQSSLVFLKKIWVIDITILDKNTGINKEQWVKYILWEDYMNNLSDFELIFKTPGISPYQEKLLPYIDIFTTQAQIFFDNYKAKIIWITGTKGKSTTSTLTYEVLKNAWYNVKLVWNIGNPVLEEVNILWWEEHDFIIYELSSYMLEQLNADLYIWVLNNIYNCHLDWHDWRGNYDNAKFNVLKNAKNKIINFELKDYNYVKDLDNVSFFWENWDYIYKNPDFLKNNEVILKDENIVLQWEHNRKNISAVIAILDTISNNNETKFENLISTLKNTLENFSGLPHRIENIWTYKNITFIDDAIATTPESTMAAIKTFWNKLSTIFLWWADSWFEFDELRNTLKQYNIKNIVLFPDTWEKIFKDYSDSLDYEQEWILEWYWDYHPNILKTKSMKKAVEFAYRKNCFWKICLLSCAAPSFSLWSWYIEKWESFKKEVILASK